MTPKLALMVITDGRWDYLQRTLESAAVALDWPWQQKILVDDSGEEKGFCPDGFEFVKQFAVAVFFAGRVAAAVRFAQHCPSMRP